MANVNPINGVPFGQERTREDFLARSAWEYDQASRLRATRHPVGYTAIAEGHERAARDYERAAEGRPSVPASHVPLRTPLQEKLRGRRKRAHATKRDRAADLIASYKPWASSYSNEDFDRVQSLAGQLTDLDREEGRPAPAVGYSKERYAQAKQVVEDTNRYGKKQQSLRAAGRSHATKKIHLLKTRGGTECGEPGAAHADINRVTCKKCLRLHEAVTSSHARKKKIGHHEAKRRLEAAGIDFSRDSDELRMSEAQLVADTAREAGYRKRKDAPGSTARMYFQYLRRLK
jgi:hypothetical protein